MLLIQKYQMEQRISELERNHDYKEGVRQTCRNNKVALTTLNGLTIKRLRVVYGRTLKHYELNPEKAKQAWFENQLRLFHWVLLIESFLTKKPLNQFSAGQWETIQSYFPLKNPKIFQFEAKKLLGNDPATYSRSWLPEECELLCRIMDDQTLIKKWNEVARKFYELSRMRFFRTSKQCREQWLNHLDYSKIHGQWSQAEDKLILEFVLAHGRKWAQVCKEFLPKRTQHMIKNRFKSLLARGQQSSPAKTVNQRRMIKKILAKLKAEPKKEEKSCLIEKLPAYHSSRGEEREESQGSVASNSKLLLSGCAKINEQNIQSIINQQEQSQQNKKSVSGNPQRPSPSPVTYQSATNLSAPPGFGNLQTFMTQQTISQSLPFFTCNPFYPNFFTIVNPIIPFAPLEGNGTLRFFGENAFSN